MRILRPFRKSVVNFAVANHEAIVIMNVVARNTQLAHIRSRFIKLISPDDWWFKIPELEMKYSSLQFVISQGTDIIKAIGKESFIRNAWQYERFDLLRAINHDMFIVRSDVQDIYEQPIRVVQYRRFLTIFDNHFMYEVYIGFGITCAMRKIIERLRRCGTISEKQSVMHCAFANNKFGFMRALMKVLRKNEKKQVMNFMMRNHWGRKQLLSDFFSKYPEFQHRRI